MSSKIIQPTPFGGTSVAQLPVYLQEQKKEQKKGPKMVTCPSCRGLPVVCFCQRCHGNGKVTNRGF